MLENNRMLSHCIDGCFISYANTFNSSHVSMYIRQLTCIHSSHFLSDKKPIIERSTFDWKLKYKDLLQSMNISNKMGLHYGYAQPFLTDVFQNPCC